MSTERKLVDFFALETGSSGARAAIVAGTLAVAALAASPGSAAYHCHEYCESGYHINTVGPPCPACRV